MYRVDGAETSACSVVHCAYLTAAIDASYPNDGGYFGPPEFGQITGNISGRLFSYGGQEYFFRVNVVEFTPSTDGGAGDSKIFILFTQPLQERPVLRLGWQVGDTAFAFADAETFLFDAPTSEEEGFEHRAQYVWSTTGLRWNSGDRVLIKIVEMPVTATVDAATYAADEGGSVEVTVTLGGSFETKTGTEIGLLSSYEENSPVESIRSFRSSCHYSHSVWICNLPTCSDCYADSDSYPSSLSGIYGQVAGWGKLRRTFRRAKLSRPQ